jgi:hypothetical protein
MGRVNWDLGIVIGVAALSFVIIVVTTVRGMAAEYGSEAACVEHGEKYVNSRTGYTICEQLDGSAVVRIVRR